MVTVYKMKIDNISSFEIQYDNNAMLYYVNRFDGNAIASYSVYDSLFNRVEPFTDLLECIQYLQDNFNDLF